MYLNSDIFSGGGGDSDGKFKRVADKVCASHGEVTPKDNIFVLAFEEGIIVESILFEELQRIHVLVCTLVAIL